LKVSFKIQIIESEFVNTKVASQKDFYCNDTGLYKRINLCTSQKIYAVDVKENV